MILLSSRSALATHARHTHWHTHSLTLALTLALTLTGTHTPDLAMIHWRCVVVIVDFSAMPRKTYCCPLRRQNAVGRTSSQAKYNSSSPPLSLSPSPPLCPTDLHNCVGNLLGLFLTSASATFQFDIMSHILLPVGRTM